MNLPAILYALRWLIWDTLRQSLASGIFWVMLLVSAICIAFCLSINIGSDVPLTTPEDGPDFVPPPRPPVMTPAQAATIVTLPGVGPAAGVYQFKAEEWYTSPEYLAKSGVTVVRGNLTLAFGAIPLKMTRDRSNFVHFVQLVLAGWVADTAGILLALVWTAGFLPSFLDPSAAAVLLAKPLPRWTLLLGKYLGVLAFVALQSLIFVGGTWLALALRTGVWDGTYLLSIPLLLLHFAIFFSFSVLLAVCLRSTIACVIGSILFWLMCWGMNFGRHMINQQPEMSQMSPLFRFLGDAGYWILPKPADLSALLFNALQADNFFTKVIDVKTFQPDLSILSSLAFTVVVLAMAGYQFATTDY